MQIYPIKSEADYRRALKEIEPYFDNPPSEDDPVCTAVDVMITLIVPKDLVPCIGQPNRVYEILSGKRRLTLPMIRKLHEAFGIPLDFLVRA